MEEGQSAKQQQEEEEEEDERRQEVNVSELFATLPRFVLPVYFGHHHLLFVRAARQVCRALLLLQCRSACLRRIRTCPEGGGPGKACN